jgi:ribosomal protein L37AE/L43A
MTPSAAGKGDDNRISDYKKYRENFDNIFKKKKEIHYCPNCNYSPCDRSNEDSDFFCCPNCGIKFEIK